MLGNYSNAPGNLLDLSSSIEETILHSGKLDKFRSTYRNDRVAFAYDIMGKLGRNITFYQEEILGLFDDGYHRVAVRGPHGLGKTFLASILTHHSVLTAQDDAKCITTASAWRQLEKYLWAEIKKHAKFIEWSQVGRSPYNQKELLTLSIRLNGGTVEAFAVASDDHTTIEGAHARFLTYIFDEAKAIPRPTWDAAEGAFSNAESQGKARDTYIDKIKMYDTVEGEYANQLENIEVVNDKLVLKNPIRSKEAFMDLVRAKLLRDKKETIENIIQDINVPGIFDDVEVGNFYHNKPTKNNGIVVTKDNIEAIQQYNSRSNSSVSIGDSKGIDSGIHRYDNVSDSNRDITFDSSVYSSTIVNGIHQDISNINSMRNESLLPKNDRIPPSSIAPDDESIPQSRSDANASQRDTIDVIRYPKIDVVKQPKLLVVKDTIDVDRGTVDEAYAFAISTPGNPSGQFYDIHTHKPGYEDWVTKHVTIDDAIRAGRINKGWVEQRARQWGKDSSVYQNRVLGEFADSSEEGVIPLSWIRLSNERWKQWVVNGRRLDSGKRTIGCDVARSGSDKTVLALRTLLVVENLRIMSKVSTTHTASVIKDIAQGRYIHIEMDGGIGAAVYDILRRDSVPNLRPITVGAPTTWTDSSKELKFLNVRAAMWWNMRELLNPENGYDVCIPPVQELIYDLSTPMWGTTEKNLIVLESKDSIRARIGRSTDYADAVCLAFWNSSSGGGVVV